ncbi:hypothetical protein CHLRE_08g381750v5 [Chlamydomonas reinhardtii]|uniref:Uncharacterized protein n=1 Tax=Chlamydomonas reinhardtii TaxID=3055 RepID=A0A2K3DI33_CHLRE|nr:uncharacterized protein CHLRE_08g381750v5 [Chlamydomonas reinhardtii]PNW80189.1 hypothetical protein CHLRE_08g381750v5 [Chlamydomonas reinhardtii]
MGSQGHRRPSRCTIAVAASAAGADEGAPIDTITAIEEAAKNEAKERVSQAEELVAEAKEAAEKKGTLKDTITALKLLEIAQLVKEANKAKQKAEEAKQKAEEAKQKAEEKAKEAKKAQLAAEDITGLHGIFWLVVLVGLIMWPSRRQESSFQAQPPGVTYVFVSEATYYNYVRLPQAGRPSPIAEDML